MPTSPSGSCLSAVMAAQHMCSTQALTWDYLQNAAWLLPLYVSWGIALVGQGPHHWHGMAERKGGQ